MSYTDTYTPASEMKNLFFFYAHRFFNAKLHIANKNGNYSAPLPSYSPPGQIRHRIGCADNKAESARSNR